MNMKIFFKRSEQKNNTKIVIAKNGILVKNENKRSLNLFEGKIININQNEVTTFNFSETSFDLKIFNKIYS